jgi:hypothetical protein
MRITVSPRENTLRFRLGPDRPLTGRIAVPAVIDVGESGRLVGVEADLSAVAAPPPEPAAAFDPASGTLYIALDDAAGRDHLTRSAAIAAIAALDAAGAPAELIVPRRGAGYEITYPSGNR